MVYRDGQPVERWGFVGSAEMVRIVGGPRAFGIQRKVMSRHTYLSPGSLPQLPVPIWESQLDGSYRMNLDSGPEFQFTSLYTLVAEVQKRHRESGPIPADDSAVSELVWIADQLLSLTEILHQPVSDLPHLRQNSEPSRCSLGLTDPHNILYYYDRYQKARIALPDLFFASAPSPIPPPWLTGREDFLFLWRDPEGPQLDLASLERQPSDPARDVRLIARIFAWMLTGEKGREQRQDPRFTAGVWPILRGAALAGSGHPDAINSASEFRSRLWVPETGLAEHFARPWQAPGQKLITGNSVKVVDRTDSQKANQKTFGKVAFAGIVLLLLGFVGSYIKGQFVTPTPPPEPSWLCKNCGGNSPVSFMLRDKQEGLVKEFHQEFGDTCDDRVDLVIRMDVIQKQFKNLELQLRNLQEVEQQIVGQRKLSDDEQTCLRKSERDRFLESLGVQWSVMYTAWQNDPALQNIDMTPHFQKFRNLYNSSRKFFEGDPPPWHPEYSTVMRNVIGLPLEE